ncbi:uncharacterized protein Triagg1_5362 [Trichoderma aggressivum f. europaeum]|uniref:F-box domain-containing protein n=1 Tax=Trichoderma aggressivum f. europaeum TaxID=173218 RepID=A0AAE1ICV1_9HYPO|nr:hypothetical protein Triagg1_5362 [Trichoderma aggressivum f. europaeum]
MIHLPGEIIVKILSDECISKPDLKNLRLSSKWLSPFAADLLFSRIYISKLKSDRESFFNIAAQPHLAAAVQTVTWLEMLEDESSFNHDDSGWGDRDVVDSCFFSRLRSMARALFWIPIQCYFAQDYSSQDGDRDEQRAEAIQAFKPTFFDALDRMPKLKELTSQPMPPQREFVKPSELWPPPYPFTCQMFLRADYSVGGDCRNDGFCTFLIPYMAHRADLPTLDPITRLRLVDESTETCAERFDATLLKGFQNLTHLDLCISTDRVDGPFWWLGQCFQIATALEKVRLCFERCRIRPTQARNYFKSFSPVFCTHSSLRTLMLVDMPLTLDVYRFIRGAASSLKTLRFENTDVTVMFLEMLFNVPDLRLEHFMSLSDKEPWEKDDDDEMAGLLLTEEQVLDILSGTNTEFFLHWLLNDGDLRVYTHYRGPRIREPSFFDSHHRVTSQDGIEEFQLIEWMPSGIEDAENYDADGYDDAEVDIEEDGSSEEDEEDGSSEEDDDDGDVDTTNTWIRPTPMLTDSDVVSTTDTDDVSTTDTDAASETDDDLMDFYANLLENSGGS